MFPCIGCGACCRHVNLSEQTSYLDRGDGICQYYNETTKLCNIYEDRPDICRVRKQYELNYKNEYTWDQFVAINIQGCYYLINLEE